tara:strand:+ start:310 stop:519 length:210 start_codon:yes stop_codon:yes gene_type:complete
MKVGDLVELSSYGRSLICLGDIKGSIGMVTNKKDVNGPYYNTTVVVQWFRNGEMVAREHPRKDLKMLKH